MHALLPSLLADQLPLATQAILFAIVFIGLALWLLGRRLAPTTCAMVGMLAGLALGMAVTSTVHQGEMTTLVITFCALGGMVLAWLLYRIWMSLSLAAALALAVPIALMAWQGTLGGLAAGPETPERRAPATAAMKTINDTGSPHGEMEHSRPGNTTAVHWDLSMFKDPNASMTRLIDREIKKLSEHAAQPQTPESRPSESESFRQAGIAFTVPSGLDSLSRAFFRNTPDYFRSAWHWLAELAPRQQQLGMLLAGSGAVTGLLIGLLFPTLAASMVSALLGSLFMILAGYQLLALHLPPRLSQSWSPRSLLLAVSLITLLGLFVQWTMSRRSTDK